MARPTYYRSEQKHAIAADNILHQHAQETGWQISLPVPIEDIVEKTYQLRVLYGEIDEPPGTKILGALSPSTKTIHLNERHEQLFAQVMGPEHFTLAHELAHWIYDAENPNQQTLDLDGPSVQDRFCYHRESPGLAEDLRMREVNANNLASHLLLPEALVRAADVDGLLADTRGSAEQWGVSHQCLQIRLKKLGLVESDDDFERLW